jgi:Pyruvate/2-oxoacid:ferredoxin oxidoreductase delta subunit
MVTDNAHLDDLPEDIELSRNADRIVTAVEIRIDCRHCWTFCTSGPYNAVHVEFEAHMKSAHPEVGW